MENAQPIGVGTIVADTYEVTSLLGQGGMGAVWAARHLRLPGKRVAIKFLHTALAAGEAFLRFRREAEIASRIGHPNIVEVLDFNTLPGGQPYLVLELLEGESLAARLRRGRMPGKSALDVARQIGSALHAAHRMGVVHRDLKPDNVFLCPRDVDGELRDLVKVLDFGISKIRGSQTVMTQDAVLVGTPQYMSPEQATGRNAEIDQRTDVFALGAIVFEMLSGRPAFVGESLATVIFQVVYEKHPDLVRLAPEAPAATIAAVDQALSKNANDRFPDMAAFVLALTGRPLMDASSMAGAAAAAAAASRSQEAFMATAAPNSAVQAGATPVNVTAPTVASPASGGNVTVPPVVASTGAAPAASRSRTPLIAAAVAFLVVAAGGGLAYKLTRGPASTVQQPAPVTAEAQVGGTAPSATKVPAAASAPEQGAPSASPAPDATAQSAVKPEIKAVPLAVPATPPKRPKSESLPAEVVRELDDAEASLRAGKPKDAIRAAEHTLLTAKSARAYSIKARARCQQGDLGGAKAELPHVSGADKARVVRECKAAGVEL